jgi:hypothetical protein
LSTNTLGSSVLFQHRLLTERSIDGDSHEKTDTAKRQSKESVDYDVRGKRVHFGHFILPYQMNLLYINLQERQQLSGNNPQIKSNTFGLL